MTNPSNGRITGLAVDPSDPSRPDDTFVFNVTGDDKGNTSYWHVDGFTGGVFVASVATALPYIETSLPAVQFEPVVNDFANAQPLVPSHDLSYNNSFECIPAGMPF